MTSKIDPVATPGEKLLRLFRKLMLDGRKHFQRDLAEAFQCSPQTILRMAGEIEAVIGTNLESGLENRRKWYRINTLSRSRLGLDFEELRYLSVCRDLAASHLPEQVLERVDETIFSLSMLMADQDFARREESQKRQLAFFSKGRIDYSPHFDHIEKLVQAIENKKICLVRYKAAGKQGDKEHRFAPSRLASMGGALYVLGAGVTEDYSAIRHLTNLAVHRITDLILTERAIPSDLPQYAPNAFGLPWHEPREFRIHFQAGKAADYVRERIWADEQRMEEQDDGSLILELTTRSEPEVLAWVRSFGEEAALLA
jgi:predicted DNA-binding transcriptional regulator YafY